MSQLSTGAEYQQSTGLLIQGPGVFPDLETLTLLPVALLIAFGTSRAVKGTVALSHCLGFLGDLSFNGRCWQDGVCLWEGPAITGPLGMGADGVCGMKTPQKMNNEPAPRAADTTYHPLISHTQESSLCVSSQWGLPTAPEQRAPLIPELEGRCSRAGPGALTGHTAPEGGRSLVLPRPPPLRARPVLASPPLPLGGLRTGAQTPLLSSFLLLLRQIDPFSFQEFSHQSSWEQVTNI